MKQEKKKLSLFNIYSLGVGGAIGSGIFVLMGSGIAATGHSIFLSVAIGCIYMLIANLFQPVMASMFILPGGDYDMKLMLFNPTLTGISALFTYLLGFGISVYAIAMVDYASMVFPGIIPYAKLIEIIKLVRQYPERWQKSVLHMPRGPFTALCVLAAAFAFLVGASLLTTLSTIEMITCVVLVIICVVVSVVRLKTGAVKKEALLAAREAIIHRAIESEQNAEV